MRFLKLVNDFNEVQKLESPVVALKRGKGRNVKVYPPVAPEPVGPANNEIWYTTTDGEVFNLPDLSEIGLSYCVELLSNTYENGVGKMVFDQDIIALGQGEEGTTVYPMFVNMGPESTLLSVTIPDSITIIGGGTFAGCNNLTSINSEEGSGIINIPDSVTSIGSGAFVSCINIIEVNCKYAQLIEGAFPGCDNIIRFNSNEDYTANFPNTMTTVSNNSFGDNNFKYYYYDINGFNPRYGNGSTTQTINSVIIGNSVTSIDSAAFGGCSSLTSITIGNSVTSIGNNAFYNCISLTNITIPDSVTSIGDSAFNGCSSLTSITFNGTMTQWNAITKGSNWSYNVPATVVHCTDGDVAL